jgi:glycosyltransferase involved in cell wall biosynthesis
MSDGADISTKPLRIAIVTDAWFPHVSGVATTIDATRKELERTGHTVLVIGPRDFKFTVPTPGYPEIKLAFFADRALGKMLDEFKPDAIHIAVEGPLGMAARSYCLKRKIRFSTAYHTRFPEYVHVRTGIPESWTYAFLKWFHGAGVHIMVSNDILKKELESHGFKKVVFWSRGVDNEMFNPEDPMKLPEEHPIFMYMGRVAIEKNIEAFLKLDLPGTKYVVGDGPARPSLERKYPKAVFTGYKFGRELARYVAGADVFVFPSVTDTFGLVMLEANACGVPVAAVHSQAANTVVKEGVNGVVSDDLKEACLKALKLSREKAREVALSMGWKEPTEQFVNNLIR